MHENSVKQLSPHSIGIQAKETQNNVILIYMFEKENDRNKEQSAIKPRLKIGCLIAL